MVRVGLDTLSCPTHVVLKQKGLLGFFKGLKIFIGYMLYLATLIDD